MGVSEFTATVAQSIAQARSPLSARESYLLYILQGMPTFRDVRRLDLWDQAFNQVMPDNELTKTEELIAATFEVAGDCLYGAYNESSVRAQYTGHLLPLLNAAKIPLPISPDFSSW